MKRETRSARTAEAGGPATPTEDWAERRSKVAVVGIGGVLMGDDAAGPFAVEHLRCRWHFPDGVELIDGGTPGPDLHEYLEGWDALILLDAIRSEAPAGSVRLYRLEELLDLPPSQRISPHDPDLAQALMTARLQGLEPREMLLVGVVPAAVELGTELSPQVAAAMGEVERTVIGELRRLGHEPRPRRDRGEDGPDVWWR